ncbi:MAG: hypothetical protein PVG07_06655, partial [Acidobacteriota bacterium]
MPRRSRFPSRRSRLIFRPLLGLLPVLSLASILMLCTGPAAAAPTDRATPSPRPRLVKDIHDEPLSTPSFSSPRSFVALGDLAFFLAGDPADGLEPRVSDGTAEGTRLLIDLCPGTCDSFVTPLRTLGDRLLFSNIRELWTTDGSLGGTARLPGRALSDEPAEFLLGELTGPLRLVYAGPDTRTPSGLDQALWVTDGTPQGTRPFYELTGSSRTPLPGASLGHTVLFVRESFDAGTELWGTDGTESGTGLVSDILPGDGSSSPDQIGALGSGIALFAATGPSAGRELWRSDGTASGTRRVADLNPGPGSSNILFPPVADGSRAFFVAEPLPSGAGSLQLWVSDGSGGGTRTLTAFAAPEPFGDRRDLIVSARSRAERFQVIGGRLYFVADDGVAGLELWTSDGTLLGTRRVADLCSGSCASAPRLALDHPPGTVLFTADDGSGRRPWVTDGTAPGTRPLVTACGGPCPGSAFGFRGDGRRVFFVAADDPGTQRQLWVTDGTAAGTVRLTDFGPEAIGLQGGPDDAGFAGGRFLFAAHDPERGTEPWASDGTRSGTGPLADLSTVETASSEPRWLLSAASARVFFTANDPVHRDGLWVSDGTAAGTRAVRELVPGDPEVRGTDLVATVGPRGLFVTGGRLWVSDGTGAGTTPLADLPARVAGAISPPPIPRVDYGELDLDSGPAAVFFLGEELWVSDGTASGTGPIADLQLPPGVRVGPVFAGLPDGAGGVDRVVFSARGDGGGSPAGLWITDGTAAGTRLLVSGAEEDDFLAQQLTAAAGLVFFGSNGGGGGFELWVSDGTAEGTGRLDAPLFSPGNLTAVGGRLFFSANSDFGSRELWVSDGTTAGTRMVTSAPGEGRPTNLRITEAFGGRLAFVPDDGVLGHEPWVSDGTAAGTRRVIDLWPGPTGSEPEHLEAVGDRLVFTASTPDRGR